MHFRDLPKVGKAVIIATTAGAAILAWLAAPLSAPVPVSAMLLAATASWMLGHLQVQIGAGKGRVSLGFAGVLCFTLIWGPLPGALIGLCEGAAGNLTPWFAELMRRRRTEPPWLCKVVFNAGNHALSAAAAGLVYVALHGGRCGVTTLDASAPPAMAATLVYYLLNTWLTSAIIAEIDGQPVRQVWRDSFEWTLPAFLGTGAVIVLGLTSLYHGTWRWTAVTLIPTLYFVLFTYRLYRQKVQSDLEHTSALNELNHSIISSLANAINAKDHYTTLHLARVQCYALAMADHMRLPSDIREAVRCASLVHDIGKIGVPEYILRKPGPLSAEEYRRVQEHVEIGAAILRPVRFPWPVVETVLGHHERWDGKGYPRGLAGEDIPIGGRIVAVANVFDALTSDRPYRKAMAVEEAVATTRQMAGAQFDPSAVEALLEVLPACRKQIDAMARPSQVAVDKSGAPDGALQDTARENTEFLAMYNVGRPLPVSLDLADTLDAVLERVRDLVPATDAVIFVPGVADSLSACAARGTHADDLSGCRVRMGQGPTRIAFEQGREVLDGQPRRDIGVQFRSGLRMALQSALACPIRVEGQVQGVLTLYHEEPGIYTPEHARLVAIVAEHAAASFRGALKLLQTEEMAYSDALTGLPNARALNAWLARRLEHCRATREPFAVLITDLDNFKTVNDTWGHLAGDQVLRDVANAIKSCIRAGDVAARYAGDEFVVGIQTASAKGIASLTRRLTDAVDAVAVAGDLPIGASTGCAVFPDDGLSAAELLQVADRRMYEEKSRRKQGFAG